MRRAAALLAVAAAVVAVAGGALAPWRGAPAPSPSGAGGEGIAVVSVLAEDAGAARGFARALAPRAFRFPADHGPHPAYRAEWWYFTGNLRGDDGRRFGFELTFFRFALAPPEPAAAPRRSAWATRQAWMAHLAVTDVGGRRFRYAERVARGALGLAGATAAPLRVHVEDWEAAGDAGPPFAARLRAADETAGIAIDLDLHAERPPIANGERGLSRKGPEPGNASYYYSIPRLAARGRIVVDGEAHRVRGRAWLDREWGTSALGAGLAGWDWFALQLDDGRDLMLYLLRRRDGRADPASAGTLVEADGRARALAAGDFAIDVRDHWTSPRGAARYPSRWRIRVPAQALDLEVRPRLPDQELALAFRYWEGAVEVVGRGAGGRPVRGEGYVELTGYD